MKIPKMQDQITTTTENFLTSNSMSKEDKILLTKLLNIYYVKYCFLRAHKCNVDDLLSKIKRYKRLLKIKQSVNKNLTQKIKYYFDCKQLNKTIESYRPILLEYVSNKKSVERELDELKNKIYSKMIQIKRK